MTTRTLLPRSIATRFRSFFGEREGAILVEFALVLPLMLLLLSVMFETGRMMRNHQIALAGVRDAARYLARTAPVDICITGGTLTSYTAKLTEIVTEDLGGSGLFTPYVTVNSVTPSLACVAGTYRLDPAPVATVTASVTIAFPFSDILALFGGTLPDVTTTISDEARVFGQ